MMSRATPVKVCFLTKEAQEGVIRRFSLPVDIADKTYEYITNKVKELFKREIEENASIYMKWKDDEGDLIAFSSEEEAREAVRAAGDGTLNINAGVEIPGKPTHQLPCEECKEPVTGTRYVCLVCPNYNMCDTCEAAGHHLEHDMVKMVKHEISEVMEFPQDQRGEFVPPPRFRRWMNRFTRRWHRRNGCLVVNGDHDDDEASELSPVRRRRWGSPRRQGRGQEWDSLDRRSMRRAWRRRWMNEDASGDDSEYFDRKRGRGGASCHPRANRRFWRRNCQGAEDELNNEDMVNRRQWRRRRCGRRHNEEETCDEESSGPVDIGARGRRFPRRCSLKYANDQDIEDVVNETKEDRASPSRKKELGKENVAETEDAMIEESAVETEKTRLGCKGKRRGRRCHRKSEEGEVDENMDGEKGCQFRTGRRCRRRYANHTDKEGSADRERSMSINGRRYGRRCTRRYEQEGNESTERERSLSRNGKTCGRRHARFSDDEGARYEENEERQWSRKGGWRKECGGRRWCPQRQGRRMHPGIRTWRRFAKMMTDTEDENNASDVYHMGGRKKRCGGGRRCPRPYRRQMHPGIRTWRRFAKMMTETEAENYDSDESLMGRRSDRCKRRRCSPRRQGRQMHPGIRTWRRFAKMMANTEADDNDTDVAYMGGRKKRHGGRRRCSRPYGMQMHPGIRTWRRFAKMMTETEAENYDSDGALMGRRSDRCKRRRCSSHRQGRQMHPGIRTWRRFAKMMANTEADDNDTDVAYMGGRKKKRGDERRCPRPYGRTQMHPGIRTWQRFAKMMAEAEAESNDTDVAYMGEQNNRRGGGRRCPRREGKQMHPGIRTWRRFAKMMVETENNDYDPEGDSRLEFALRSRGNTMPYFGIKKGNYSKCRIPMRLRFRN